MQIRLSLRDRRWNGLFEPMRSSVLKPSARPVGRGKETMLLHLVPFDSIGCFRVAGVFAVFSTSLPHLRTASAMDLRFSVWNSPLNANMQTLCITDCDHHRVGGQSRVPDSIPEHSRAVTREIPGRAA